MRLPDGFVEGRRGATQQTGQACLGRLIGTGKSDYAAVTSWGI